MENSKNNTISSIFKSLAWFVFFGGIIAGIEFGNVEVKYGSLTETEFSFTVALTYWATSFVSGMLLLGFSEIIQLLTDIRDKISISNYSLTNIDKRNSTDTPSNKSSESSTENTTHLWRCDSCGNLISEDPCPLCKNDSQTKLDLDVPYWCAKCGKNGPYDGFCPKCGSSLKRYNVKK